MVEKPRSRLQLVFKPTPEEQQVPFWGRVRFAAMGANHLTAVTHESHPELSRMIEKVSSKAGIEAPVTYIWQSKKQEANAVALPSHTPTIAFSQPALELLNPEELAAVAGHELGHVKNMGSAGKMFWLSVFGGAALADLVGRPVQKVLRNKAKDSQAPQLYHITHMGITAGRFIAPIAAGALASRHEEYAADRHAGYTMEGDVVPLMSALAKLEEYSRNPDESFRDKVQDALLKPFTYLTRTHPSFKNRMEALGIQKEEVEQYRAAREGATEDKKPVGMEPQEDISSEREASRWQERLVKEERGRQEDEVLTRVAGSTR